MRYGEEVKWLVMEIFTNGNSCPHNRTFYDAPHNISHDQLWRAELASRQFVV